MLSGKRLRQYLAYAVLDRKTETPARKPPAKAKRSTPRRGPERDAKYLAWIRTLPCAACGRHAPSEAAHTGDDGGMSQKASDYSAIPLCPGCHRTGRFAYHRLSRAAFERAWAIVCAGVVARLRAEWRRAGGVKARGRTRVRYNRRQLNPPTTVPTAGGAYNTRRGANRFARASRPPRGPVRAA